MIEGRAQATIHASAQACYEFVLDLDRYREADHKIGTVRAMDFDGHAGEVRYTGRLRGMPSPPMTHLIEAEPYRSIVVRSKPGTWQDRLGPFDGVFTFTPMDVGTTDVEHVEQLSFRGPARPLLERMLGDWLAADTPAEIARMKVLLEADRRDGPDAS